ncbi:carbohydrate ABC transporter substrate-binding protein [Xylanibacillus composti]|uniref:ABC transporter substrate-binding protein n=1 Tax=Xylanibacillus composti TaxID=1572762 RepID=A0A8J4H3D7_9BACL|nr:ABC transporter substrate-binding protein [Xylanibacillus composti]MDT9727225.1 carbohydrate ABC transporter substrate-binding protein [Xylanibacillus composti]GIQ68905.1 ABC transporter substrate-binding protein [Xylanibacillus composti]
MKRWSIMLLAAVLVLVMAACSGSNGANGGGSGGNQADAGNDEAPKKDVTIKMFQFKVEIADALNQMAAEYEQETGVKVIVETHGGGEDYNALLKAEIASGSEPEIFNSEGFAALEAYYDRAEDLSGESWAKDVIPSAAAPAQVDGKLLGMPMNIEGYGINYNKELFQQAGIEELPTTLSELEEVAQKLEAAGITPFATTNEWWSIGQHTINIGLAEQADPVAFIEDTKSGDASFVGNEVFEKWINYVDLVFKYSQSDKLTTDYATQVALFATGQAAMIQQGNWIQGDIDKVAQLDIGVMPIPIDDSGNARIYTGPANFWIVNSKSKHPEEAKAFLEWMVTSETGKRYLTEEFQFIPALTTIEANSEDIGQLGEGVSQLAANAGGWHWGRYPDGIIQGWGAAMQEYQGGTIGKEELFEKFDKAIQDIVQR